MNNSIFIADQDSLCGQKITDKLILNNFNIIQTVVNKNPLSEEMENEKTEQKLSKLDWNCFSTISPKNIILQSRQFSDFNTAAVIFTPPNSAELFVNQTHIEIQKSIDFYFRSLNVGFNININSPFINFIGYRCNSRLFFNGRRCCVKCIEYTIF